ncbi:interleukin-17 receptor C-like isoform X1 [Scyliorhinus canicula]|uniref:interleukin-17 receptor C-like isoform X1 n=1 Tax=Scyliorhinus canicula TaxID=7830 RepID=UPI0018F3DF69|nr:interleukin-17 receptor C-like isoform X1 [Scyliorhinus canicula]
MQLDLRPLLLLLWLGGIRSLEKFRGPLLEASCPHEAFSCEAKYNCEQNNEANTLLLTNLITSTILYCEEDESCTPCIRVQLTVKVEAGEGKWNLAGSGSISKRNKNVDTESEDEDYNEGIGVGLINITSIQPNGGMSACAQLKIQFPHVDHGYNTPSRSHLTGTVELRCFQTAVESDVQITASIGVTRLRHMHKVEDCTVKDFLENIEWCKIPNISTTLENKTQMAVIHVPPNFYTMFKYKVMAPFESRLVTEKLKASDVLLNYSDIVPCLCVQVWSATIEDARRCEKCPFSELEEFQENIWKWSSLAVEYEGKALQWTFSSPCDMKGEISLCSRSGGGTLCQEIPHSRRTIQINQRNEFRNVDPHPALCIKVISGDHVNFSCPFDADHSLPWEVDTKLKHRNVTLMISHRKKEMNFSICAVKGDKCEHVQPNVKMLDQKKQLDFVSQDCIQVWRSDVKFSPRITICPYEMYARERWTPFLLLFLILFLIVIATITVKTQLLKGCIKVIKWKPFETGSTVADSSSNRNVLLLYSLDHNQFEKLVNTFASVLCELQFQVIVDLWKRGEVGAQGPLPWVHSQKKKVAGEGGKIVILLSKGASVKYNEWLQSTVSTEATYDPYDGFMASLNCVLPDIMKGHVSGKYVVVYFEDLQKKEEIPEVFSNMPIYSLPAQLSEFLQELGMPANFKPEQEATSHQSTISNRLHGVIKECQLWEQNHLTWCQDNCKSEWTLEGQQGNEAMVHYPLI